MLMDFRHTSGTVQRSDNQMSDTLSRMKQRAMSEYLLK